MRATRCGMSRNGRLLAIVQGPCGLASVMRLRGGVSWAGDCLGRIIWEVRGGTSQWVKLKRRPGTEHVPIQVKS